MGRGDGGTDKMMVIVDDRRDMEMPKNYFKMMRKRRIHE